MPSIDRPLSGDMLFRLDDELREINEAMVAERGHSGRTLMKNGPLRVTLISIAPNGSIREHHAEGPITVHVLSGQLQFVTPQKTWDLNAGDLLTLEGGVRHSVVSRDGAVFLLTISNPEKQEA